MNRIDLTGATESRCPSLANEPPAFNLVITHDCPAAALEARFSVERLLSGFFSALDIHRDEWSFSELGHPDFQREALELAANCDLLVVSAASTNQLPKTMEDWLKSWARLRERKETAMVCLTHSAHGKPVINCVLETVRDLAESNGLSFFSSSFASRHLPPGHANSTKIEVPAYRYTPRPEAWGINE